MSRFEKLPPPPPGRPPSARRPLTTGQPRAHGGAPAVSPETSIEDDDGVRSSPYIESFGVI
jgi:hypothetical protein